PRGRRRGESHRFDEADAVAVVHAGRDHGARVRKQLAQAARLGHGFLSIFASSHHGIPWHVSAPSSSQTPMSTAARTLSEFAATLDFGTIPEIHATQAGQCLIDTVGVCLLGSRLPWGMMVADYARRYGAGGTSRMIGLADRVSAPLAALANGVFAHGFE